VSGCLVEVGPAIVRGPRSAPPPLATTALECIDDEIAIVDDAPVAVKALWCEVFRAVLPEGTASAVLVCPTWWPPMRVERVREAAALRSAKVFVLQRAEALCRDASGDPTLVEIAPDFVLVTYAGAVVAAQPRLGESSDVARSVADDLGRSTTVLIDAPPSVVGAAELAGAICESVRTDGVSVTTVHQDRVLRMSEKPRLRVEDATVPPRRRRGRSAALAALVVSVSVTLLCLVLAVEKDDPYPSPVPMTLLVEGGVALKVPALWEVRRITSGPGSARVQVTAPDGSIAVLVTQSRVKQGETLSATSVALRNALDDQDAGVFSQFDADDRRADRPAVTYRELRGVRQIDWTVLVDGAVRIAVGCQSAPGEEGAVHLVCEEAIRSVRAIS
jgi:type VII secretion-associated protein (TIGR03931 family)